MTTGTSSPSAEVRARDAMLLVGDLRVQRVLGLIAAPRVFNASLPLEVVTHVENKSDQLHTVVVSSELAWAGELRDWMATDHPAIRVVLLAPTA